MNKVCYFIQPVLTLIKHFPFTAFNFLVSAWTIISLISISGLSYTNNDYVNSNDFYLNQCLIISFWYPIIFVGEFGLEILNIYFKQRNKNWWNLSLIVESVKESYIFKFLMGIIGFVVLGFQIYVWSQCPSELKDCKLDFYPRASTPVPFEKYQELVSFMKDSDCLQYIYAIDELIPQNITSQTNQTIPLDMYLELQEECYALTKVCKPYCSDRSKLVSFLFSVVTGAWGLIFSIFYDGPHHVGIPHHLKVFDKLRIRKWYCLPAFWSSPSELVQLLLPMLVIQQSCKGGQPEEFEYMKKKHSDLPWDWLREFTEEDFDELKLILPHEQKTMSPAWEIIGPISKLYKPLKQLAEIKKLEENDKFNSLRVTFVIWFEPPAQSTYQDEQSIKVSLHCKEKGTYNFIQFGLLEIQKLMGLESEDCIAIQFDKVNIPKFLEKWNWKCFNDKAVHRFFPSFMQKLQQEQQVKQEGETQAILVEYVQKNI